MKGNTLIFLIVGIVVILLLISESKSQTPSPFRGYDPNIIWD